MPNAIRVIVRDYGWIHLSIGLLGNVLFFSGGILFLPTFEQLQPIPTWMSSSASGSC